MARNIFGRIWAAWGLISFSLSFLVIFIPSMCTWLIPNPTGQTIFIGIARLWMRSWLFLVGCPFRVRGKTHFRKGKTYIVVFNHNSMLDIPLSCPFVPGGNKTIAKDSFVRVPLFGFYYMKGAVLVNRNNELSRKKSFEKMKAVLAGGMHMCIYPEGTRNRSKEPLKKFHDGAFRLAESTGHEIIPTLIFNTKKALPLNRFFFFLPKRLEMHFLEPVPVSGMKSDEIRDKVFEQMKSYYEQHA